MEIPGEIVDLARRIFGEDIKLRLTKNPKIQAHYNPLGKTLNLSRGLIDAHNKGYMTLRDVEAILWHEHGESIYYRPRVRRLSLLLCLLIAISMAVTGWPIKPGASICMSLALGILLSTFLVFMNSVYSPVNRAKELLCDVHAAVGMGSIQAVADSLSKAEDFNSSVQVSWFRRVCDRFMESLSEHPENSERIGFLREVEALCRRLEKGNY